MRAVWTRRPSGSVEKKGVSRGNEESAGAELRSPGRAALEGGNNGNVLAAVEDSAETQGDASRGDFRPSETVPGGFEDQSARKVTEKALRAVLERDDIREQLAAVCFATVFGDALESLVGVMADISLLAREARDGRVSQMAIKPVADVSDETPDLSGDARPVLEDTVRIAIAGARYPRDRPLYSWNHRVASPSGV